MAAHLPVGLLSHRNKSRPWVFARYFGTFNRSRQDRWVFGDRQAAPTCTASPGPGSSVTRWSDTGRPPTTRNWPNTGPRDDAKHPCRSARPTEGSSQPRTAAATPATGRFTPPRTSHRTRRLGTMVDRQPHRDHHDRDRGQADGEAEPRLIHAECRPSPRPGTRTPPKPQGLLEPDAGKLARPVLRGAGRSNAPGLPGASALSRRPWRCGRLRRRRAPR